jgi:hypothetical protein
MAVQAACDLSGSDKLYQITLPVFLGTLSPLSCICIVPDFAADHGQEKTSYQKVEAGYGPAGPDRR